MLANKCVKRRQGRNLFPRLPASASVWIIAASSHWSDWRSCDPATAQACCLNAVQDFPMGAAVWESECVRVQMNISLLSPPPALRLWLLWSSSEASCLEHILNTALCIQSPVNSCTVFTWVTTTQAQWLTWLLHFLRKLLRQAPELGCLDVI